MTLPDRNPPQNTLNGVPSLETELAATVRAILRREEEPKSVMHALILGGNKPQTLESISSSLDWTPGETQWTIETLQEEGWMLPLAEHGLQKYLLTAPYVSEEARPYLPH